MLLWVRGKMMIRIGRWNIQFGSLLVIVLLGFISTCFIFQVLLLSAFYSSHIVSHTNIQIFDQSFCSASSFARIDYFKMSGEKISISMSIKHKMKGTIQKWILFIFLSNWEWLWTRFDQCDEDFNARSCRVKILTIKLVAECFFLSYTIYSVHLLLFLPFSHF